MPEPSVYDLVQKWAAAGAKPEQIREALTRGQMARVGFDPPAPIQVAPQPTPVVAPIAPPSAPDKSNWRVVPNWLTGRVMQAGAIPYGLAEQTGALGADIVTSLKDIISPSIIHTSQGPITVRHPAMSAPLQTMQNYRQQMAQDVESGRPVATALEHGGQLLSGMGAIGSRILGTDVPLAEYKQPMSRFMPQETERATEAARQLIGGAVGLPGAVAMSVLEHGPQALAYGAPDVAMLAAPHLAHGIIERMTGRNVGPAAGAAEHVRPETVMDAELPGHAELADRLQSEVQKGNITPDQVQPILDKFVAQQRTRLTGSTSVPKPSAMQRVGKGMERALAGEMVTGSLGMPTGVGAGLGMLSALPLPERMSALARMPELATKYREGQASARRGFETHEAQADPRAEARLRAIADTSHIQQGVENLAPELGGIYRNERPELITDKAQGAEFANRPGEQSQVVESTPSGELRTPLGERIATADVEQKARDTANLAEGARLHAKALPEVYSRVSDKLGEQLAAAKFFRKAYWMDLERKIDALKLHDQETRGMKREIYDASAAQQEALSPEFDKYRQEKAALGESADTMFEQQRQEKYGERAGQSAERTRLANEQAARRGELMGDRQAAWADLPTRIKQAKEALKTAREEMTARHQSERADMAQILREVGHREKLTKAMLDHVKNDESLSDVERAEAVTEWTQKWNEAKNAVEAKGGKELWDEIQKEHAAERAALNKYENEALKPTGERTMNIDEHLREHVAPHVDELVRARDAAVESVHEQRRGTREMRSQREQLASEHGRQSRASEAGRASQRSILADLREELSNQRIRLMDQAAKLKEDRATRLSNLELNRGLGREPHVASVEASKAELERVNEALRAKRGEVAAVPGQKQAAIREVKGEHRGLMKELSKINTADKQRIAAGATELMPAGDVPIKLTSPRANEIAKELHEMTQRFTQPKERVPLSWYQRVISDPALPDGLTKLRSPAFRGAMEEMWQRKITEKYGKDAGLEFKKSLDNAILSMDKDLLGAEPKGFTLRVGFTSIPLREMVRATSESWQKSNPARYREMQADAVAHNLRSLGKKATEAQFAHGVKLLYEDAQDAFRGLAEQPFKMVKKIAADISSDELPPLVVPFEVKGPTGVLHHAAPSSPVGKWLDNFVQMPTHLKEFLAREGGGKTPEHLWIDKTALSSLQANYDVIKGFKEAERLVGGMERGAGQALSIFKTGHTILSHATHINNIAANLLQSMITHGKVPLLEYARTFKMIRDAEQGIMPSDPAVAEAYRELLKTGKVRTGMMDTDIEKFSASKNPVQGKLKQAAQQAIEIGGKAYSLGDAVPKLTEALRNYADSHSQLKMLGEGKTAQATYASGETVTFKKVGGRIEVDGKPVSKSELNRIVADHAIDRPMAWTFDYTKMPEVLAMSRRSGPLAKIVGGLAPYASWGLYSLDIPGVKKGLVGRMMQHGENVMLSDDPALVRRGGQKIFNMGMRRMAMMGALQNMGIDTNEDADVLASTKFGVSPGARVTEGDNYRKSVVHRTSANPWISSMILGKVLNYITASVGGAYAMGKEAKDRSPRQEEMVRAKLLATGGEMVSTEDLNQLFQRGGNLFRSWTPKVKGEVGKDKDMQATPGAMMLGALDFFSPELRNLGDIGLALTAPQWSTRKTLEAAGLPVDEPVPAMVVRLLFSAGERQVDTIQQARKWGAHIGSMAKRELITPLDVAFKKALAESIRNPNDAELKKNAEVALKRKISATVELSKQLQRIQNPANINAARKVMGALNKSNEDIAPQVVEPEAADQKTGD